MNDSWHPDVEKGLLTALGAGRLGHALLICGMPGIGKRELAGRLAQYLLCSAAPTHALQPCGECKACWLYAAGNHPDLLSVRPDEPGKAIRVDRVRELGAALALTAQLAGNRVGIIDPAHAMNANAANSLLKSLEEPPARTYLLLVSDYPARLPATVRSRCQRIALSRPAEAAALGWLERTLDPAEARRWLSIARGAPLRAADLAAGEARAFREDLFAVFERLLAGKAEPVGAANPYVRTDLGLLTALLDSWVSDLIRLRAGARRPALANVDLGKALAAHAGDLDLVRLFGYLERIRATAASAVALNQQLVVEDLFVAATRLTSGARGK